jgi:hypothetical protein
MLLLLQPAVGGSVLKTRVEFLIQAFARVQTLFNELEDGCNASLPLVYVVLVIGLVLVAVDVSKNILGSTTPPALP